MQPIAQKESLFPPNNLTVALSGKLAVLQGDGPVYQNVHHTFRYPVWFKNRTPLSEPNGIKYGYVRPCTFLKNSPVFNTKARRR